MDLAPLYSAHLDTLCQRADAALAATGFDHLVIYGGGLRYAFLDDNAYAFRVNPHFKRWLPVTNNPQCLLVYVPGEKPRLAFYSPVDFWHKTHPVPTDFWAEHFDITPVTTIDEAAGLLPKQLKHGALIGETEPVFRRWPIEKFNPQALLDHLHYHFAWKTGYELECLRAANRLGARAHLAAERAFRAGASEYEIHFEYMRACEHTEQQLPYANIIGLNENAAILHYQYQERRPPNTHRSFLIDAGASFNGYYSDITRTYSAKDDDFQQLIDRMERAQLEICERVVTGVDYVDLQLLAHQQVAEILVEFDLATGDPSALVSSGVTRAFFPHGVGHYLGAQVHDVGGKQANPQGEPIPQPETQPFLRLTREIETDQVFTVEPGLYFIPSLLDELRRRDGGRHVNWPRVDIFRPFGGIRIEDNIRVTADGHENFTRDAFQSAGRG